MKKENIFELLREWKGYTHSTDLVCINKREFYYFHTFHTLCNYEKERIIAKYGNKSKGTIKNLAYWREKHLSLIYLMSRIRGKKTLKSKLSDGDADRQLSIFNKHN